MQSKRLGLAASALLLLCLPLPSYSQAARDAPRPQGADIGAFIKEIMVVDMQADHSQLAMWFPYEFFVSAAIEQGTPRAVAEKDTAFIKPFLILVIQNKTDRPAGGSAYLDEKQVRARAVLRLAGGEEVMPLVSMPPLLSSVLSAIKTATMAEGDVGSANMHIVVFPNSTARGKLIVDASLRDSLTLVLKSGSGFKETEFTWRTPFDAVAGTSPCPRCKATMSSKWSYCPYDGQKLTQ
jgi:hypothetical protein